jgi:hypothetical protein
MDGRADKVSPLCSCIILYSSRYIVLGEMSYANGDVYSGGWLDDVWNGTGKLITNKGDIYEGGQS